VLRARITVATVVLAFYLAIDVADDEDNYASKYEKDDDFLYIHRRLPN
jgi:hypothetical protein